MLFPEEDAPLLKAWIVKRIEDTSDADAEVLAEYIIALLKHDGTKDEVRALCEAEIPDFLTEDPKALLDDVFQAIAYKSYVPGAPPPPKLPPRGLPTKPASHDAKGGGVAAMPAPHGSRKRGYNDIDASEGQEGYYNGQRPLKNPRLQGRGWAPPVSAELELGELPPMPIPPYGPNGNPMAAAAAMMGMDIHTYPGVPPFPGPVGRGGRQRRRGRCRDFDRKGFCARGSSCIYNHGNGQDDGFAYFPPPTGPNPNEYDPTDALIPAPSSANQPAPPFGFGHRDSNRGRGNRREGGRGSRRGGARASFSAEGPINDRSKSTIVVENIPEEHFSEDEVRTFFSQFGTIVEVSMQPYKHLAIVKYDKWASANAAYRSPKVIFDNRFVKVFWYKDDAGMGLPPSVANGASFNDDGGRAGSEQMSAEPEIDLEEFRRRQEEAQRQHQERESKRAELERQRQELEKKQQELLERHREETQRLQNKLREKNGDGDASATGTDMLRAKLAALEQEAKILGIDPDAAADETTSFSSRGGYRGGYRGRGRGRGRGAWRGAGRGGAFHGVDERHTVYAQYSLDNRPKRLAITGVDFSAPEKDEMLRHYLLNLGEFESVDRSGSTTYVSFRDRKTAEKLYHSLHGKELAGVEGKLDLQWVTGAAPPASAAVAATAGTGGTGGPSATKDDDEPIDEEDRGHVADMDYSEQRAEDEDAY